MSLQASSVNEFSVDMEERAVSKGYPSYNLFVLMLPAFFILPLALFSLQEWWLVWSEQGSIGIPIAEMQSGLGESVLVQSGQTLATYGWTAFVQGICWLAFVVMGGLGFLLQRSPLIGGAYLVLLISLVLQWQLPPILAG